jgi:hypothetical protein
MAKKNDGIFSLYCKSTLLKKQGDFRHIRDTKAKAKSRKRRARRKAERIHPFNNGEYFVKEKTRAPKTYCFQANISPSIASRDVFLIESEDLEPMSFEDGKALLTSRFKRFCVNRKIDTKWKFYFDKVDETVTMTVEPVWSQRVIVKTNLK